MIAEFLIYDTAPGEQYPETAPVDQPVMNLESRSPLHQRPAKVMM